MAGRAELDEAGQQVTAPFFGLCDSVMDHGGVKASATKAWQSGGICQQADPIFHIENPYTRWHIVHMGDAKIQT